MSSKFLAKITRPKMAILPRIGDLVSEIELIFSESRQSKLIACSDFSLLADWEKNDTSNAVTCLAFQICSLVNNLELL
jgi:hypothetical protein